MERARALPVRGQGFSHLEQPAHPDLEYYRKQAKHLLRSYGTGDAAARARAADVLGERVAERFLLSDAQFVLAQEHGFRNWADFRAHIQSQSATGDRPVARLWGAPGSYASTADALLTELRRGDPGALQRLRAYVPRYAAATDASTAELRDARLIIVRELGFPTWRELVEAAEKSRRDLDERQEKFRRLRPEAEALLAGDTGRLAQLTAEQADALLQMLAVREILGTKLGEGLGVPRAAVDVLIGKARFLAPSTISAAAGQTCGSAVYLCSAAVGANARFCRDDVAVSFLVTERQRPARSRLRRSTGPRPGW
jgi:hypothetical protein